MPSTKRWGVLGVPCRRWCSWKKAACWLTAGCSTGGRGRTALGLKKGQERHASLGQISLSQGRGSPGVLAGGCHAACVMFTRIPQLRQNVQFKSPGGGAECPIPISVFVFRWLLPSSAKTPTKNNNTHDTSGTRRQKRRFEGRLV